MYTALAREGSHAYTVIEHEPLKEIYLANDQHNGYLPHPFLILSPECAHSLLLWLQEQEGKPEGE